jgi:3-hydroxyisobutyrate dehydrogenase-like beta-hydroxyacid dehydrogenase
METVGFIGLGNMGGGMANNIQKAGYPLVVYDVREGVARTFLEAWASLGSSPADVASRCDVTLTSLPGPREVEAVSIGPEGILEGNKAGSVYIDLSTSRPTLIREIEPKFRAKGVHVLDAPVSGGKSGAQSRNLAVMVGGEREIFDRMKPLLDAFGDKVFYAGSIGAGSVAKLVHNMIGHGIRRAVAETLTLGVKAGVDRSLYGSASDAVLWAG